MSMTCIGFLVFFSCSPSAPVAISDFCENAKQEIAQFHHLTDAELKALQRPRKEAMLSLRHKYDRLCH